ncbi:MAG TPA: hypothetical protein EYQ00_05295 [Dehalococcoidia bacterium]|jgi:hypothetical protein|nr:hypothetical protein [Dehalococcoidia bacterium]
MSSTILFEESKIVAVMGGVIDNAGSFLEKVILCEIITVGENDLLLKSLNGAFRDEVYMAPKDVCVLVSIPQETLVSSSLTNPEMGDLVISYEKKKWSDKEHTSLVGILCEMTYVAGSPNSCKILCNGEFESVGYESLLVLQKRAK